MITVNSIVNTIIVITEVIIMVTETMIETIGITIEMSIDLEETKVIITKVIVMVTVEVVVEATMANAVNNNTKCVKNYVRIEEKRLANFCLMDFFSAAAAAFFC